ncbi:hypothetical protein HK102_009981, partial [Quaeritorhiza haematococci]
YYPAINFGSCNRRSFESKQSLCGTTLLPVEERGSLDPSVLSCPLPAMSSNTTNTTGVDGASRSSAERRMSFSIMFGVNAAMIGVAVVGILQFGLGW